MCLFILRPFVSSILVLMEILPPLGWVRLLKLGIHRHDSSIREKTSNMCETMSHSLRKGWVLGEANVIALRASVKADQQAPVTNVK